MADVTSSEEYEDALTHAEASEYLGISQEALYGLVRYGTVKPERITISDTASKYYNMYPMSTVKALAEHRRSMPKKAELSEYDIVDAVESYKSGEGIIKISKRLGIGTSRMKSILVDAGVEIRKSTRTNREVCNG